VDFPEDGQSGQGMTKRYSFRLPVAVPYSLERTVVSHGWVWLQPYAWDERRRVLSRTEYSARCRAVIRCSVSQRARTHLSVRLDSSRPLDQRAVRIIAARLNRALSADESLKLFGALARRKNRSVWRHIRAGGGRLLRGADLFEDVVKTLFTTNCSWAFTEKMVERFIGKYGRHGAFPAVEDLRDVGAQELRRLGLGYRGKFLAGIIRMFRPHGHDYDAARKYPGFGPYAAAHVGILNRDYSHVPIDSSVESYCERAYGRRDEKFIRDKFASWHPYEFLGYKLDRSS